MIQFTIVVIFLLPFALFALMIFGVHRKRKRYKDRNLTIDRDKRFWKLATLFKTQTASLDEVANAIDWEILKGQNISWEPHINEGYIVFKVRGIDGTLVTSLQVFDAPPQVDICSYCGIVPPTGASFCPACGKPVIGRYQYLYTSESFREKGDQITLRDELCGNVILTVVERAFLRLDPDMELTREKVDYNSKFKLFGNLGAARGTNR